MKRTLQSLGAILFTLIAANLFAQSSQVAEIQTYLSKDKNNYKPADYQNLLVTNFFKSEQNGATYLYAAQEINGIRIANSSLTAVFDADGNLRNVASLFYGNIQQSANSASPDIDLSRAVKTQLESAIPGIEINFQPNQKKSLTITGTHFSHSSNAELVYYAMPEGSINLAWSFDCPLRDKTHWYHYFVDAHSGELLKKIDWQVECSSGSESIVVNTNSSSSNSMKMVLTPEDGSGYEVVEFPLESPNHGPRTLASEPATTQASPFGWHDINGIDGAEYMITRGNNVYAYEDVNDQDSPGFSPDGGSQLLFVYPYDQDQSPESYQSAAITNLFYANNRIHDILVQYGFDEASGNFQTKNYSATGVDDDEVRAESQDGGGSNNANFGTPPDGFNPTMQMYLWQSGTFNNLFVVNTPSAIGGGYLSSSVAAFGPEIPSGGITANMALANDGVNPNVNDGCEPISNNLTGKIAILYRGSCDFVAKVKNAQNAGALACIVVNNVGDGVIAMGGVDNSITIPSVMIGQTDGEAIIAAIGNGTVNATLNGNVPLQIHDGSFDNGIITHEYCHGVSNRLTGGSANSDCLSNEEQMGEGWSDWYSVMLTMNMDVANPAHRPMGTFASGDPVDGNGIRPVPYDTSMVINSYTYADLGNSEISVPHGVGFVWATMLWDLSWALMDEYGYDPDLDAGTGGNNLALQLITDALKLQVCEPGFIDGRDAILLADELDNDGANKCLIWKVFARRGLGYSASQGSSQSRTDGTAAYDIPSTCLPSTTAPQAAFSSNVAQTCNGIVQFSDESINVPQTWTWDFGDGSTSEQQNPNHVYETEGVYTVSLEVSNELGSDATTQTDLIEFAAPDAPEAVGASGCSGDTLALSAISTEGSVRWLNEAGDILAEGNAYNVALGNGSETYFAQSVVATATASHVGPVDTNFGTGGNHGSTFTGTVDFTTYQALTIHSAYVVSGEAGQRVISLWQGAGGTGELLQQVVVNIDFTGAGTIDLGFEIQAPGSYSIGLSQANLYRNDTGADYPYVNPGLITITGSSAGPEFYYYLYNLEVSPLPCLSEPVEVLAEWLGSAQFSAAVDDHTVTFLSTSASATSWAWSFGDGATSTEENPIHTYIEDGTYSVSLTTSSGCTFTVNIEVGTSGIDSYVNSGFAIMPNPADNEIRIENTSNTGTTKSIVFYDMEGRIVEKKEVTSSESWTINVKSIPSGMYMISVLGTDAGTLHRQRILIMH